MKKVRLPPSGQPSLFEPTAGPRRVRGRKRIAVTTIEAYRKVALTMGRRQREVMHGLVDWIDAHAYEVREVHALPTSYELFHFLRERGQAFDISGVRSVLTGLKDMGLVEWFGIRECTVTGERVHVWRPAIGAAPSGGGGAAGRDSGGPGVGQAPAPTNYGIRGYSKIESRTLSGVELERENAMEWNAHYPRGTRVWKREGESGWSGPYRTMDIARMLGGRACVPLDQRIGVIPISRLHPASDTDGTLDTPPNNQSDL